MGLILECAAYFENASMFLFCYNMITRIPSKIPIHINIYGNVDKYGNKYFLFIFPVISAFLLLLIKVLIWRDKKYEDNYKRMKVNIGLLIFSTVTFMSYIAFLIAMAGIGLKDEKDILFIGYPLIKGIGLYLIALGLCCTGTKQNSILGIRVPYCYKDYQIWKKVNNKGGLYLSFCGLLFYLSIQLEQIFLFHLSVLLLFVGSISVILWSHIKMKKIKKDEVKEEKIERDDTKSKNE